VFKAAFGYESTVTELEWVKDIANIMKRLPTAEELKPCHRKRVGAYYLIPSDKVDVGFIQNFLRPMATFPT
jgi:hypothetical protein